MTVIKSRVWLFVHIIWAIKPESATLSKPIRTVLFPFMQKQAAERGISLIVMNGVEDHLHCLVQLHATQNLSQVVRHLQQDALTWINESNFQKNQVQWTEEWLAYSISPSAYQSTVEYIQKQEEYHKTRSLEQELAVFEKMPVP